MCVSKTSCCNAPKSGIPDPINLAPRARGVQPALLVVPQARQRVGHREVQAPRAALLELRLHRMVGAPGADVPHLDHRVTRQLVPGMAGDVAREIESAEWGVRTRRIAHEAPNVRHQPRCAGIGCAVGCMPCLASRRSTGPAFRQERPDCRNQLDRDFHHRRRR
jgi:hypothetical protein